MSDDEHKKLVKGLMEHFESRGLKIVAASYDGYEKCDLIGSHEPDVIAQDPKNEIYYIGEAKTCDVLDTDKTREQFEDFGNAVELTEGETRKYLPFCIAVPNQCLEDLKKYIFDYGLSMNENIEMIGL